MQAPGEDPVLDAETKAPVLIGLAFGMLLASLTAVALRLYTRYVIVKAPGADDALIAVAAFLSIGVSISNILQTRYGLGRHFWMVSEDDMLNQLKALLPGMELYNTAQIATKISFAVLYRRIFEQQAIKTIGFYLIIFLSVWGVVQNILVGFSCNPVATINPAWNDFCVETLIIWYLTSVMNIVTDFIVFLLPMFVIRSLQLKRQQKLLTASLFGVGFFTCIISIVRLFYLHQGVDSTDQTWDNVDVSNWTVVELNSGIICACLPAVRRFCKEVGAKAVAGRKSATSSPQKKLSSGLSKRLDGPVYQLRDIEAADSQQALADTKASKTESDFISPVSGPPSCHSPWAETRPNWPIRE